jgi:hypothetical protein
MITADFAAPVFDGLSARNRSIPGRLSDANPANPSRINPRRDCGPGHRTDDA